MPPSARSACPSRVSSTPSSARFLSHSLLTSEPRDPLDTHVLESGPERRCPTRNGLPLLCAAAGPIVRADGRVRASDRPSAGHRARRDRDARHRTAETWPIGSRQALERRAQARGRPALGSRGESVELVSCELGLPIFKLDPWRRKAASAVDGALNQREAEAVSTVRAAAIQRIGERDVELALMAQAASPSTASPRHSAGRPRSRRAPRQPLRRPSADAGVRYSRHPAGAHWAETGHPGSPCWRSTTECCGGSCSTPGLTRGKRLVALVGQKRALAMAAGNR